MNRTNDDSWDLASGVGAAATMVAEARAQPMADLRGCLVGRLLDRAANNNRQRYGAVRGHRRARSRRDPSRTPLTRVASQRTLGMSCVAGVQGSSQGPARAPELER
jgi:hypothetical protein